MNIKLLTEHHLEFLSFKWCCTGLSESTHVKMPHCWKSHVTAHLLKMERNMWEIHFEDVFTGQLVIQGDIEEKKNCTDNI